MTGTFKKLYRALGPLAGGILLDTLDLATFGPFGLYIGWLVGLVVGWWIASIHEFGPMGKASFAALAAVYLTMPMTELFPVATIVSAAARFRGKGEPS
jgi:hypothetical protein